LDRYRSSTLLGRLRRSTALALLANCALVTAAVAETPGKDGDLTVSGTVTLNAYAALSGSPSAGATSITTATPLAGLTAGDLIMVYQAQGATINTADTSSYGSVTSYGSAGFWEFQTVGAVSGSTITLANYGSVCGGLRNNYFAGGRPQVIRVPQYRNLTINAGGSVVPPAWNGTTGGVVALQVSGTLTNNGVIHADALGFRGGAVDNLTTATGSAAANNYYRATASSAGAEKGEGIAGYQTDYDAAGRYGRGAPANGGGGGNGHNAGGGGGANGDNGNIWAGQGRPDTSGTGWGTAWNLDPSLNAATNNSGGGRGGYTYGSTNQNALTVGPGSPSATSWGGDFRRELGGLGGRPLAFSSSARAFFGGGGGAGDGNNNAAGRGGRGGGLVMVVTNAMAGSGQIRANGEAGVNTVPSHNDAPGGGGGGGTIVVANGGASGSISYQANGGAGGNQLITNNESEGPGGGGGGGVIATTGGIRTANGGNNGTSSSAAVTEFTPNGATRGASGQANASAPSLSSLPFCFAPSPVLQVQKASQAVATSGPETLAIPGAEILYTVTVTNPSVPIDSGSILITDPLPADVEFLNADIDGAGPATTPVEFIEGTPGSGLSCCAAANIAYSQFTTGTDFTYVPAAGFDPLVKRIRVTPTGSMAAALLGATSFSIRFKVRIK
jgi:uncharacterized repeat protein (TIGR01451 family)